MNPTPPNLSQGLPMALSCSPSSAWGQPPGISFLGTFLALVPSLVPQETSQLGLFWF